MAAEPMTRQQIAGNLQQIDPVKEQAQATIETKVIGEPLTPPERKELPVQVAAMEEAKNEKAQGIPDRQAYEADIKRGNDAIAQEKIRLRQQMQEGVPLTRGQKVAFALMTIGVAVAGATKGKRGMAAAGSAISGAADKVEKNQLLAETAQNAILKPQLSALNAQEKLNNTALMRSAEAPIKNQEALDKSLSLAQQKADRGLTAGVGVNKPYDPNNMARKQISVSEMEKLASSDPLIEQATRIQQQLGEFSTDSPNKDRWNWQLNKLSAATPEGKVNAQLKLFVKNMMKSIEGGRPSDFDAKQYYNMIAGDILVNPEDVASLLGYTKQNIANNAAGRIRAYAEMGGDPLLYAAKVEEKGKFNKDDPFARRIASLPPVTGYQYLNDPEQREYLEKLSKIDGVGGNVKQIIRVLDGMVSTTKGQESGGSSLADQYKSGQITKKQYLDMRSKELMGGV